MLCAANASSAAPSASLPTNSPASMVAASPPTLKQHATTRSGDRQTPKGRSDARTTPPSTVQVRIGEKTHPTTIVDTDPPCPTSRTFEHVGMSTAPHDAAWRGRQFHPLHVAEGYFGVRRVPCWFLLRCGIRTHRRSPPYRCCQRPTAPTAPGGTRHRLRAGHRWPTHDSGPNMVSCRTATGGTRRTGVCVAHRLLEIRTGLQR